MAHPSTLYRFRIDLSDVDRGVYENLDFRVALHPSETNDFLLTRVLAFALNWQEGLAFSPGGLSDTEEPAVRATDLRGDTKLWIEIGNPSAKKVHRAAKASPSVKIYTYKDPGALLRELNAQPIYQADRLEIYSFAPEFLNRLAGLLQKDNKWSLLRNEENLSLTAGETTEAGDLRRHSLS